MSSLRILFSLLLAMLRHPHSLLQPQPAEERRDLRDAEEARSDGQPHDSAEKRSPEATRRNTTGMHGRSETVQILHQSCSFLKPYMARGMVERVVAMLDSLPNLMRKHMIDAESGQFQIFSENRDTLHSMVALGDSCPLGRGEAHLLHQPMRNLWP